MSNRQDEYVLGKEVTAIAKGRGAKATTVVSVRFAVDEVIRLEQISQQTGKSVSDIIREAVSSYMPSEDSFENNGGMTIQVGYSDGSSCSVGDTLRTVGRDMVTEGFEDLIEMNSR
jgi:predicted DNA-binding protein